MLPSEEQCKPAQLYLRARLFEGLNDPLVALRLFARAVEKDSSQKEWRFAYAELLAKQENSADLKLALKLVEGLKREKFKPRAVDELYQLIEGRLQKRGDQ